MLPLVQSSCAPTTPLKWCDSSMGADSLSSCLGFTMWSLWQRERRQISQKKKGKMTTKLIQDEYITGQSCNFLCTRLTVDLSRLIHHRITLLIEAVAARSCNLSVSIDFHFCIRWRSQYEPCVSYHCCVELNVFHRYCSNSCCHWTFREHRSVFYTRPSIAVLILSCSSN